MMAFRLLVSVLFFITATAFAQDSVESRVLISGIIKDSTDNPVSYAHIFSKTRNEGWVSDYYGIFRASVVPGDSLLITAISFQPYLLVAPVMGNGTEFISEVIMKKMVFVLNEVVIRTYPATYSQLKREFLEVVVEDPADDIDLHLPSMKDLAVLAKTPGVPGQIGLYSGPGPFSIIYNQFSKEAKSKRLYAELMYKEKAGRKYNKAVVSKITGLKNDDKIIKFMEFCALQIKFILESTEYELYAAVLGCYNEYCERGYGPDPAAE